MPKSKEIQEHITNKVTNIYQSGKSHKDICETLDSNKPW